MEIVYERHSHQGNHDVAVVERRRVEFDQNFVVAKLRKSPLRVKN